MKSQEQKEREVLNYLDKTSQHLFVTKQGVMFKIITFKQEGELYYSQFIIKKDTIKVVTNKVKLNRFKRSYKDELFESYLEIKSIRMFKKLYDLLKNITLDLGKDDVKNQERLDKLVEHYKFFEKE